MFASRSALISHLDISDWISVLTCALNLVTSCPTVAMYVSRLDKFILIEVEVDLVSMWLSRNTIFNSNGPDFIS